MSLAAWLQRMDPKIVRALKRLKRLPERSRGTALVPLPFVDRTLIKSLFTDAKINTAIRKAPLEKVPFRNLSSIQRTVNALRVAQYVIHPGKTTAKPGPVPVDVPIVVRFKGRLTLWDGNHRTTAAIVRGEKSIRARVADLDTGV